MCPKDSFYSQGIVQTPETSGSLNGYLHIFCINLLKDSRVTALHQIILEWLPVSLTLGKNHCFFDSFKILTKGDFRTDKGKGTGPTAEYRWTQTNVQTLPG